MAVFHPLHRLLLLLLLCRAGLCDDFATPQPGRVFQFPRDHGSHPDFRTEWWYITGHLDGANGQRFGFQVTFFRQAALVKGEQLFLAHCAMLDAKSGKLIYQERLNREGWDAESSTEKLDVHNGNWTLGMSKEGELQLGATVHSDAEIKLTLRVTKPLVVFGKDGISRKGSSPAAASHYLTYPRLAATGTVRLGKDPQPVTGEAWMDHEFSSSQLDLGQVGWDWAAMQLTDGTEMMVYRMRRADGSSDPAGTTLAWIDKTGTVRHIDSTQFTWTTEQTWISPRTKAAYPISARIDADGKTFILRPLNPDQELGGEVSGLPYWEGACDVFDKNGKVIGRSFLELAGYAGDLAGQLRAKK